MKTRLVKIGNSRGIRIPKPLIDEAGLGEEVEIEVRKGSLVVSRRDRPRARWDEAFASMARRGDDALLDGDATSTRWDEDEWEW
ncbi:MAG TPA: AbrB/MazE/SpoVT family DNA-binding domain-containing protein [Pirellulales bacterium]|jgi:antitoxin MazE|nr:AbrB/MazE/SpoVT family DNA-binding domain-containing protein [Pirellulales bacterium]